MYKKKRGNHTWAPDGNYFNGNMITFSNTKNEIIDFNENNHVKKIFF